MFRRWLATAAVAALVVVLPAAAADFDVHLVSQTNTKITLGWPAQSNVVNYTFYANGKRVSSTYDGTRTSVTFSKVSCTVTPCYDVQALGQIGHGGYPATQPPPPAQCANGLDDDGDGKIDLQDPGCSSSTDTTESPDPPPPAACANGLDDDGDGKIDLADPGCSSTADTDETDPVSGQCASFTPNTPDGPDGQGGCFPGQSNTGPNAPASSMATYTGSCTISTANVTIDSRVVNCRTLVIASGGAGFTLSNSYLNGGIVQSGGNASFTVRDSLVDSGVQYPAASTGAPAGIYACGDPNNQTTDCGVTGANFTILRTEIVNSNRAAYCFTNCLVQDSSFHGTNLWPDKSNLAHASSMREEQNATIRHNSLWCSYTGPFPNGEIGCSADLTGYPDFTPIKNNTVDGNLFVASPGSGFCAYGGNTQGKPFSSDPTNATNQKFTNNVFQRGSNSKCAAFGPITDFSTTRAGNVWSNNKWSDGTAVSPG